MGLRSITSFALSLLLVVPALIDAGCSARSGNDVNGTIATLANAGVATYETYASANPIVATTGTPSAMRFTRWQLKNMLAQSDAGMGMSGAELDRLEGPHPPKNAPMMSQFIAAWVLKYDTPLAAYSKTLMASQTLDQKKTSKIIFPLLVVGLFVADIARMNHAAPTKTANDEPGFERWIAAPAEAVAICSKVSNFVASINDDVEAALADVPYVGGILVKLWGVVVGAVKKVVSTVLAPILAVITAVSAGLAALTTIASTLSPWVIKIKPNPASVNLSAEPFKGDLEAEIVSGTIDWPEEVADCAQQLSGIDLASISSEGAPVTWTPGGEIPARAHVDEKNTETKLKKNSVRFVYDTLPLQSVPPEKCTSYDPAGKIDVDVKIERVDVQHLANQISQLAFSKMNKTAYDHLKGYFDQYLGSASQSIENFIHTPATGHGSVDLNIPVFDTSKAGCGTPTPAPTPTPTATPDATSLVGDWSCAINATVHNKELGDFHVSVNTSLTFNKTTANGFSNEGASMSGHNAYNGPGTGAQHAGTPGAYTYTPEGPDTGTLTVDNKVMHLTWTSKNAWSTSVTSPVSKRSYLYQCHR